MPTYRYEAHDKFARPAQGTVSAPSEEAAAQIIREERHLFATRIELDSAEPMKTLFEHGPRMSEEPTTQVYQHDPEMIKAMYANQPPAPQQYVPRPGDKYVAPIATPARSFAEAARGAGSDDGDWREEFGGDLEGLSAALRELDLWKQASAKKSYKGPKVGKKTWALIDKAIPRAVEAFLTDAITSAARRSR